MGYDHFYINETKKQIAGPVKLTYMDYEDVEALVAYLSMCKGDTFRIVGEENDLVNTVIYCSDPLKRNYEYKWIALFEFGIDTDRINETRNKQIA